MADRIIKPDSGDQLILQDDGGGDALTIETDQDVKINAGNVVIGTAGKGVDFSQAQTPASGMTAEILDSYEEGYHTATITCSTSGTISVDGSYNQLSYTKIGRMVTVCGQLIVSGYSSPVGYAKISLPFAIADLTQNSGRGVGAITLGDVASSNISNFISTCVEGESVLRIYLGDSTSFQSDSANQIQTNTIIYITFTYFTD